MEYLSSKPYCLTDEDILWVGSTLADMMPAMCTTADDIKRTRNDGYAAMINCANHDNQSIEYYRSCIDAGVLYALVPLHLRNEMTDLLCNQLNFTGIIIHDESTLRDNLIQFLSLQAALGLHKS